MSICKITGAIKFNCDDSNLTPGIESESIRIFNWDDIDRDGSTFDATNPLKLETQLMINSATGFTFEGVNNSVKANYESTQEGYIPNKYKHTVEIRAFNYDDTAKAVIDEMVKSRLVVTIFTKAEVIDVLGWGCGLVTTVKKDYIEDDGSVVITMSTSEEEWEPTMAKTYVGSTSPQASFQTLRTEVLAL